MLAVVEEVGEVVVGVGVVACLEVVVVVAGLSLLSHR
jgi:hypothetical protein